jgi:FtsH-binding integral membrane protein
MRTGQAPGALTIHIARQFAILSLVLGIISWRVRTSARSKELNAIIFGLIIAFIILPIETALSIRNGSESAEGWLLVVLFSVLAIGFILAGRNNNSSKTKT